MLMLLLCLAVAVAASSSPYLPSTPPGTYPFAHFTDELMRNTTWQDDVKHVVLVHGFARSGSTIVAKQLRDAVGGQDCWVGRTVAAEAQLAQDVYPAWDTAPENARNKKVCAATAWAAATSLEEKQAALYGLVHDRSTTARTLLSQWRVEGDVAVLGAPAHDRWPSREGKSRFAPQTRTCATWVAKDPRLDTLQFLPWLLGGVVRTTTVLVLRHPYASVYLSEFGGGPCKPSSLKGVVGQWLAAWRRVYGLVAADALTADATAIFRTEDLLLDEERTLAALRDLVVPRRRRELLTIRGAERGFAVDASHAFVRLSVELDFSLTRSPRETLFRPRRNQTTSNTTRRTSRDSATGAPGRRGRGSSSTSATIYACRRI